MNQAVFKSFFFFSAYVPLCKYACKHAKEFSVKRNPYGHYTERCMVYNSYIYSTFIFSIFKNKN